MRFLRVLRLFLRDNNGAVQAFAAIVAVNPFGLVFVPAFRADNFSFWFCACRRRHAADSFFGLVVGADIDFLSGGDFDSLPLDDFSPELLAGDSFLAASW